MISLVVTDSGDASDRKAVLPGEITSHVTSAVRSLSGVKGFSRFEKWYERDMRPPGHPGVRKLWFAELMVDGGAAGRDLRMLVFSIALVVISTGAIFAK